MLKTIIRSTMFSSFIFILISFTNQVALATTSCTLNGKEIDCAELGNKVKGFLGWGIGGFLVILAIGIWTTVFWIMMIIHVAKHDVEDKAMWIILIVFTGIIGALIYYFMVKRKFNERFDPPLPTITK